MENIFIIIFVSAIIIFSGYIYLSNKNRDISYTVSKVDNKKYLVQNFQDKEEAADLLATVAQNLVKLCDYMKNKYPGDDDVKRMVRRFNPDVIVETASNSKHTSYSINKGEKIVLCLRSRDGENRLVDINILMFVSLHELAHIMNEEIGHKPSFWKSFKRILKEAVACGVYKHVDFNSKPVEYCGVNITSSPLSDGNTNRDSD